MPEGAVEVLEREAGNVVVFMPTVFNDPSEPNQAFLSSCGEDECVQVGQTCTSSRGRQHGRG